VFFSIIHGSNAAVTVVVSPRLWSSMHPTSVHASALSTLEPVVTMMRVAEAPGAILMALLTPCAHLGLSTRVTPGGVLPGPWRHM